jgi:hypothetical protein
MYKIIVSVVSAAFLSALVTLNASASEFEGWNQIGTEGSPTEQSSRIARVGTIALRLAPLWSSSTHAMPISCRKNAASCTRGAQCCSGRCEEVFGSYFCIGN